MSRPLRHNGLPYQGINILILWATAMEQGYSTPIWMTYQQARELGSQVRKGEKSAQVVYASAYTKTETDQDGEAVERRVPFFRTYTIFNVEQIEGLPEHFYAQANPAVNPDAPLEAAEAFVGRRGTTSGAGSAPR